MSVPTHNLYDFVHQVTKRQFLLMYPRIWGNRELTNIVDHQVDQTQLNGLNGIPYHNRVPVPNLACHSLDSIYLTQPVLFCHDQEPLNFDLYLDHSAFVDSMMQLNQFRSQAKQALPHCQNYNLRHVRPNNLQKHWLLLHSETNSTEVQRYMQSGLFTTAFWWSHAVLSLDWYRFAKYDQRLTWSVINQKFLVYCRDTTGSRSYRQTFLDLLDAKNLRSACQIGSFETKQVTSDSSAEYSVDDHTGTDLSVVLETVFDQRIHLTEKICRCLALGHPFILAAGPGSLAFLRSYGFKTFDGILNESYDNELDPKHRLMLIVHEIARLAAMPSDQYSVIIEQLRSVASYNKKIFFSEKFFTQVVNELIDNVQQSYTNDIDLNKWYARHSWKQQHDPDSLTLEYYQAQSKYMLPWACYSRSSNGLQASPGS